MRIVPPQQPIVAAACVIAAMALLGLTDNMVILLAEEVGLWQFHLLRAGMALPLIVLAAAISGQSLRPVSAISVAVRSLFVALSMMFYFGALAFVPVSQSAAGLFTAPIWVLLFSLAGMGQRAGVRNVAAAIVGFGGVLMVLQPDIGSLSLALVMPVLSGVLYAVGAILTRRYCASEGTLTLLTGFFVMILACGILGCVALAVLQPSVPAGADGFLLRGWVAMTPVLLGLIAVQALGAVFGVGLIIRAYLLAEASFVSVFEYTLLVFGALWGWVLWSQGLNALAVAGILLIMGSGAILGRSAR